MNAWRRVVAAAVTAGALVVAGVLPSFATTGPEPVQGRAGTTTVTFGADLTRPVNSDRTCWGGLAGDTHSVIAAMNGLTLEQYILMMQTYYGVVFDYPSCTWWNVGRLPAVGQPATNLGDNVVPFGGGTLTTVRVKTGPVAGPMQAVVLRFIRHPQSTDNPGGPFYVASSQVFTPQPNAINEIAVNLPVKHELDSASGLWNFDVLALSVLDANTPMPFWTGPTGDPSVDGGVLAKYPAWTPGTEQYADIGSLDRAGSVLIQGDVVQTVPDAAGTTGGTDAGQGETVPAPGTAAGDGAGQGEQATGPLASLPAGATGRVNPVGTRVRVPVACVGEQACVGAIRITARTRANRATVLASGAFSVAAGSTGTATARLTKAGRKELRGQSKLVALLTMTTGATATDSTRIVLRRR